MKKNANLPALIFMFALLIVWQCIAMGMNAAYILPSPTQVLVRLWELRKPLFTVHYGKEKSMFRWGIIFLVIALIAAALGFGGLAGTAAGAAKIVFVVGIILFLVSLFTGRRRP